MPGPDESMRIRAFAAVCISPRLIQLIQKEQERLARALGKARVRWVRPDQLHLTLRFYGAVPETRLSDLLAALQLSVEGIQPFHLTIEGCGGFPNLNRPSVIWLGFGGQLNSVQQLARQIELHTSGFGSHSESREFKPHLTVGRVAVGGSEGRSVGEVIRTFQVERLGDWLVEDLTLMQSKLHPGGSIYTTLARIPLPNSG